MSEKQKKDAVLSADEIRKLTDEAAAAIVKQSRNETLAWVRMGRIVDGYVRKLQPNGIYTRPNPYQRLAEDPRVPYRSSQLRHFRACAEVWEELGGPKAPALPMTFFTLVLNSRIDSEGKRKYLRKVEKEGLTVRELKAEIGRDLGKAEKSSGEGSNDWKVVDGLARKLNERLSRLRGLMLSLPAPPESIGRLTVLRSTIDGYIAAREGGTVRKGTVLQIKEGGAGEAAKKTA